MPERTPKRRSEAHHSLVERMAGASSFKRIKYLTLRDDAVEEAPSNGTGELRDVVEKRSGLSPQTIALKSSVGDVAEDIELVSTCALNH